MATNTVKPLTMANPMMAVFFSLGEKLSMVVPSSRTWTNLRPSTSLGTGSRRRRLL